MIFILMSSTLDMTQEIYEINTWHHISIRTLPFFEVFQQWMPVPYPDLSTNVCDQSCTNSCRSQCCVDAMGLHMSQWPHHDVSFHYCLHRMWLIEICRSLQHFAIFQYAKSAHWTYFFTKNVRCRCWIFRQGEYYTWVEKSIVMILGSSLPDSWILVDYRRPPCTDVETP